MPLLNRSQREKLRDLLMRLPNIYNDNVRNQLLTDLPPSLTRMIAFDGAPATHVFNIL